MYHIGVLGALDENIASYFKRTESGYIITCSDNAKSLSGNYDFVFMSQKYAERKESVESAVADSRILLVPGKYAARLCRIISSGCIVAFGLSAKDTITLSSIEENRGVIAIQREMINIEGIIIERQEFPVKYEAGMTPEAVMAIVGIFMILGVGTDEISDMEFINCNKNLV